MAALLYLSLAQIPDGGREGDSGLSSYIFYVQRIGDPSGPATVSYSVTGAGGSPATAADFENGIFPSGVVSFADGEVTKTITIKVVGDTVVEPDEDFTLTLSNAVGAPIASDSGSVSASIINDDYVRPTIFVLEDQVTHAEGNSGVTAFSYTVYRQGITTYGSSMSYEVLPGEVNAASGADFQGGTMPTGTFTFDPGEASKTLTIYVTGDTVAEANEIFRLRLFNPVDAILDGGGALGVITNDDAAVLPTVSLQTSNASGTEAALAATGLYYTVTRTGDVSGASTISYAITGTGAQPVAGSDFILGLLPTGTLVFDPGETSKSIHIVNFVNDSQVEPNETFTLTLSNPIGAVLGVSTATGTIENDDASPNAKPVFSSSASIATPENRLAVGTVHATDPEGGAVAYAITGGPDASFFTINAATGALSWKTAPDYETREDAGRDGVYNLSVTAADVLGATTSQSLAITVSNLSEPGQTLYGSYWNRDVVGGTGDDRIYMSQFGGFAWAGDGNDRVQGDNGADDLYGGRGADVLLGDRGEDLLVGGMGADTMTGGSGDDLFRLEAPAANGVDLITDFSVNNDWIELAKGGGGWNPSSPGGWVLSSADYAMRNAVANIAAGDTNKVIELQNAHSTSQLSSAVGGAANAYVVAYNSTVGHVQVWYDDNWSNTSGRVLLVGLAGVTSVGGQFDAGEFRVYG